jgi:hypothetical protein
MWKLAVKLHLLQIACNFFTFSLDVTNSVLDVIADVVVNVLAAFSFAPYAIAVVVVDVVDIVVVDVDVISCVVDVVVAHHPFNTDGDDEGACAWAHKVL